MASFKFVATGDVHMCNDLPHARPLASGLTDRFASQLEMLDRIVKIADGSPIFVVGDLFDKAKLDPITLVETVALMSSRGTWRILPGNHDANSLTGGRFNVEVFRHMDPERFSMLGGTFDANERWQIHAVPFASIEENAATIEQIQASLDPSREHLLLFHNAVLGCKVDGAFKCDAHGLSAAKICKGFTRVRAGHFHDKQRFGKIGAYLGAPMQHRYSDEGSERGVWIITLGDDGSYEEQFVPLHMPRFWTIAPGQSRPADAKPGDYIRISANVTSAEWAAASGNVADAVLELERDGFLANAKHVPMYQHESRLDVDASLLTLTLPRLAELYVDMPDVEHGSLERLRLLRIGRKLAESGEADRSESAAGTVQFLQAHFSDLFIFGDVRMKLEDRGLVFVGGRNEDSDGAANNGCGKTSLYKAISWILYGQTVDGETGDRVIRKGTKEARGVVQFRAGGELWTVKRRRLPGITKLELIAPSGEPFIARKKDLQRYISDLIGLDFQAFRSTVLYGRTDPSCFSAPSASDADRKDILHSILRTSMFASALAAAKDFAKASDEELQASRVDLAGARGRLQGVDPAREDALSASWQRRRSDKLREAQAERDATARRLDGLALDTKKIDAIKARQAEIESVKATISDREHALAVARRDLTEVEKRERDAAKKHATAKAAHDAKEGPLQDLDGETCPTCQGKLCEGTAAEHIAKLRADLTTLAANRDKASASLAKAREDLKGAKAKVAKAEREVPTIDTKEVQRLAKQLAELEGIDKIRSEIVKTIAAHEKTIIAIQAEQDPHAPRAAELRAQAEMIKAQVSKLELEVAEASANLACATFWIHGFGPSGLPSIVLDSVMPALTERTNFYLGILADGDIVGSFSTQRTLQSGDTRDKIEMSWTIEGNADVTPSDGQQTKIRVAVDLALMDLASERSSVDLLLFDEVLDGLDAEGMQRMLDLLAYLRSRKHSIFVISHEQGMSEAFETGLCVVKSGKVSRLEAIK